MTISEAAAALAAHLKNVPALATIRTSRATEYKQILTEVADLGVAGLPAAVISPGSGRLDLGKGDFREQTFGVVLIDRFRGGRDDRDAGIWALIDAVAAVFADAPAELPGGLDAWVEEFYPLALGGELAGAMIEVKARY